MIISWPGVRHEVCSEETDQVGGSPFLRFLTHSSRIPSRQGLVFRKQQPASLWWTTAIADPRQVGRQAYVSIRSLKPRDFVSLPRGSGESRCTTSNERSEHSIRSLLYWCKGLDNVELLGGASNLGRKIQTSFCEILQRERLYRPLSQECKCRGHSASGPDYANDLTGVSFRASLAFQDISNGYTPLVSED